MARRWPGRALTVRVRPWREWTLRTRLVAAMVVLASVALIVASTAGVLLIRSYLIGRVDAQLTAQARADQARVNADRPLVGQLPRPRNGLGQDFRLLLFAPDGTQYAIDTGEQITGSTSDTTGPDLGAWSSILAHRDSGPYTVPGQDGTPWRVMSYSLGQLGFTGVSGVSLRDVQSTSTNLIAIDSLVVALVLLMLGLAASSVVRIGLRPLTRMERVAGEVVATEDLSRRVADVDPHTESGRLGTALNAMLGRVEAAMHARTASEQRLRQFLADASHELRTPLTSIQGFAELYRRGGTPPGPELDEAMGRIENEVGRMRVLVNDLLLLARLDEERPLARQPVDLLGVAAETVRDAHVRVPTRFVQLAALDDASNTFEPVTVIGDADRLRQVVTNLVSNALQHTGDGTRIVVRVGRPRRDASDVHLDAIETDDRTPTVHVGSDPGPDAPVAVLEVADSGPGMSQADAERVFERLFRTEPSRDRRHGGAGLGLAIVAAIVQAHGGRVELITAPGAGSRFRVILPAEPNAGSDDDLPTDDMAGEDMAGNGLPTDDIAPDDMVDDDDTAADDFATDDPDRGPQVIDSQLTPSEP
ncbi:MAG TPA: HAMP domain-containing sensor histidine kinase [Micromonosporaceae bacterium]|nr:HAMP domain-containing sensor histidine kinase [Micromonosporaceae bacterium]